ncbi:uncharacterized protein LOC114401990 [Glycine soja]|uniref:uncharacterized protein LOC114401990 n=1 Tax=Glycine soja TaxID=3848 RepID=UPI00103BB484|nr:uncharacterized protein LOC114401990 [Glycine soja]
MVRTRGRPRALGSGTSRGMGRDEHDVDVPRRRRPTASARRQRVQVDVAEEVPQVTEDIPDVTEDVPHVEEDILTADVDATDVAADGAEGSPAEHGEGIPGGPHDTSLLTSFADHVLVSHGRKVDKFGSPAPEIEGLVAGIGLSPLIRCSVVTDDPGLISAFMERWHRQTSTFHLPVGELTITLDDVACLLHLPIIGALLRFEPLGMDEAVLLLTKLLEVSGNEARAETCWIFEYFPSVHQCVTDDAYAETTPRASTWLTTKAHMKGIKGAPCRACLDVVMITNFSWLPYSEHWAVRGFELISCYQGQLRWGHVVVYVRPERVVRQFEYIQTIPPPPVTTSLSYDEIDERWMHFGDHLAPVGEICVVPGLLVKVAKRSLKRLERVLNLRMVIAGTELHDIMEDILRIAKGEASSGSLRARRR